MIHLHSLTLFEIFVQSEAIETRVAPVIEFFILLGRGWQPVMSKANSRATPPLAHAVVKPLIEGYTGTDITRGIANSTRKGTQ
jgi:hypothetical protein